MPQGDCSGTFDYKVLKRNHDTYNTTTPLLRIIQRLKLTNKTSGNVTSQYAAIKHLKETGTNELTLSHKLHFKVIVLFDLCHRLLHLYLIKYFSFVFLCVSLTNAFILSSLAIFFKYIFFYFGFQIKVLLATVTIGFQFLLYVINLIQYSFSYCTITASLSLQLILFKCESQTCARGKAPFNNDSERLYYAQN